MNVVNSAFGFPARVTAPDRLNALGGSLTLQAATVAAPQAFCNTTACRGEGKQGSPLVAQNQNIALQQTAVGVQAPQDPGSYVVNSAATDPGQYRGAVTADPYTWISPVSEQSAATLRSVTGQPALLTALPGLPTNPFASFTQKVTPVLYRLSPPAAPQPGVLLDVVPDASPGQVNQLLDPETGQPITTDVFGSPRVDNNGRRNVGAVQMTLAPRIEVTRPQQTSLDTTWTRPADPASGPITGYGLYYRAVGGGGYTRIDIAGADTTSRTLTGLTPDTSYESYVVAVNALGDGPPSNVVTDKTAPEPHLSYPAGKGQVGVKFAPLKPQVQDVSAPRTYAVSSGALPKGLALDPTSGEISGTPQQSGKTNLQITVIGGNGTAAADVTIDVSARSLTPHLSYPTGKGEQGHPIDPLTPQTDGLSGTLVYEISKGELPPGLVLDRRTGVISGTPRAQGTFTATVRVTGANGSAAATVTIQVRPSATPYLHYGTVTGDVGKPVAPRPPQTSGLTGVVSYAITRGTLPRGLSFDSATGVVSGTAHRRIDRTVKVTATGTNGSAAAPARILVTRPATPLTVDARRLSARLTVGKTMKLIQKVTSPGTVRVRTTCRVHGAVANRHCDVRVTRSHKVYVTPLCNEDVSVTVRIDAKVRGKENTQWQRTWRVDRTPHTACTAPGTG